VPANIPMAWGRCQTTTFTPNSADRWVNDSFVIRRSFTVHHPPLSKSHPTSLKPIARELVKYSTGIVVMINQAEALQCEVGMEP